MVNRVARTSAASPPLSSIQGSWLGATILVTLLPHMQSLPGWLSGLCLLLLAWRLATDRGLSPPPATWLLLLVAAGSVVAAAIEYRHLLGKDPGLALLAVFACLKLLEARTVRDGRSAVLLCFFLQMGQFLNGQEIWVAALTLAGIILALGSLAALEGQADTTRLLRGSSLRVLAAIPLMLALFVLFPRIQGPLWGLPQDAYSGLTGLPDTMSPGSLGELVQSGGIAFRADFDGTPPPPQARYWRGPVLSEFTGTTWRPGYAGLTDVMPHDGRGPSYRYRMTLEPHNRPWLLALDYPRLSGHDVRYTSDLQLVSTRPVRERRRYELESFPEARSGQDEPPHVNRRNLDLPAGSNPRTVTMAHEVADRIASPAQRIGALIARFRQQALTYTLKPPVLGQHSADEFLFDTRLGFCEHFASAFAIAARAAGVPARVVTGYQGGEINPHDGTLVVRQSDAHAWVEVLLPGQGWQRIDPTAESAPSRIDVGIADALPDYTDLPLFMQPSMAWLRALQWRWEALGNRWNQWVIGYNEERQRNFLRDLGFQVEGIGDLLVAAGIAAIVVVLALMAWSLRQPRQGDRLDRLWSRFCRKLARAGTRRPQWMGPLEFAKLAATRHPSSSNRIRTIADRYASLRYGPHPPQDSDLGWISREIKQLRLK
ncbi:MAG: DUF3488 domain-containing transglutaminase family protein [Rhodocyclaceae bacterium]|nr:DUF3488 domain-containing transglutaminase family protein [Rhodocyclaceae bacterium]